MAAVDNSFRLPRCTMWIPPLTNKRPFGMILCNRILFFAQGVGDTLIYIGDEGPQPWPH